MLDEEPSGTEGVVGCCAEDVSLDSRPGAGVLDSAASRPAVVLGSCASDAVVATASSVGLLLSWGMLVGTRGAEGTECSSGVAVGEWVDPSAIH